MKRIICLLLMIIFIFSCTVLAQNELEFHLSMIDDESQDDDFTGGIFSIETERLKFCDKTEVNGLIGMSSDDYNIFDTNFIFYNNTSYLEGTYVGVGGKYLLLDNTTVLNSVSSDVTAYMMPIVLKTEDDINQRWSLTFDATVVPFGIYSILTSSDDILARCNGYGINLGANYELTSNLDFEFGYFKKNYTFKEDDDISFSKEFDSDFQGVYLGGEYKW